MFLALDVVYNEGQKKLEGAEEIEVLKLPFEGFNDALVSLQRGDTYIDLKIPGLFELAKKPCKKNFTCFFD